MPSEDQTILDQSEVEEKPAETETEPDEEEIETEEKDEEEEDSEEPGDDDDDEEKEPDEEEDEEETEVDAKVLTTWTDLKKQYPDFAKNFPDVKNVLFREQQYSEVFSNPNEAKEAAERLQTFDQLSDDVVGQGNIEALLQTVKEQSKESYDKIAYSILPYFQENEKDLYYEIAARPIKQLLRAAWQDGNGEQTDLGKAAAHIHKYFFKNLNFNEKVKSEGSTTPAQRSKREEELEQRLQYIESSKQQDFLSSVDDSYVLKMNKHIREGIDKDDRLTEWTKAKVVEDVLREIQTQLKKDTRYVGSINSLVRQAAQSGFTNDFKSRLINTALVRAKSLVPDVRRKLVAEALKRGASKSNSNGSKSASNTVTRHSQTSRPKTSGSKSNKPLTDLDLLRG